MIFANVEEPMYADNCCHLNQHGYQMVGELIGRAIHRSLTRQTLLVE